MASFNGVNLFGLVISMSTGDNRRDSQVNSYNGLNGLEVLDGGSRGLTTVVHGVIYGSGLAGLAAARELLRGYRDGNAYMLADSTGSAWPNVRLERFTPAEAIKQAPDGTCFQPNSAEFLHLTG
jgi:hypothetical protein